MHELAHGLAALATGGGFERLVVAADGSGLAYTHGGWRLVIVPAGYLGAALFAGLLIVLGSSATASRWALAVVGVGTSLLALRYGLPSLLSAESLGGLLAVVTGVGLGVAFVAIALRAKTPWITFTVHLVAIEVGLTALADLGTLVGLSRGTSATATDAVAMAEMTLLPALFWALLWVTVAAAILGAAIRWAWFTER